MNSVREETQQKIAEYIKIYSQDGKLTQSLMDIGEVLGYSNATIHRGLQALEEKGLIEITPSEKRTQPSTIFYKGTKTDVDEFMTQGVQLVKEVQELSDRLQDFLANAQSIMKGLQDQMKIQDAIRTNSLNKNIPTLSHSTENKHV